MNIESKTIPDLKGTDQISSTPDITLPLVNHVGNLTIDLEKRVRIQQFPGYYLFQVHPENPTIDTLQKVVTLYNDFKNVIDQFFSLRYSKESIPPEPQFILDLKSSDNSDNMIEQYDVKFSNSMVSEIQTMTATLLPPETSGYFKAVHYVESFLLNHDLNRLEPKTLLTFVQEMNGRINSLSGKSSYRSKSAVIYDATIMPTLRNATTFRELDSYMKKNASQSQFEIWKTSLRAKVWNSEFKVKNESGPTRLTSQEAEVIHLIADIPPSSSEITI
jgi:hypothetical protein